MRGNNLHAAQHVLDQIYVVVVAFQTRHAAPSCTLDAGPVIPRPFRELLCPQRDQTDPRALPAARADTPASSATISRSSASGASTQDPTGEPDTTASSAAASTAGQREPRTIPEAEIASTRLMMRRMMSARVGPDRQAHANLAGSLLHALRDHTVDAERHGRTASVAKAPSSHALIRVRQVAGSARVHQRMSVSGRSGSSARTSLTQLETTVAVGDWLRMKMTPHESAWTAPAAGTRPGPARLIDAGVGNVPTMPTTSAPSPKPPCPTPMRCRSDLRRARTAARQDSLMTTTFGWPTRSCSVKMRPRISRIPSVSKKAGDAQRTPTLDWTAGNGGRSGNVAVVRLQPSWTGAQLP